MSDRKYADDRWQRKRASIESVRLRSKGETAIRHDRPDDFPLPKQSPLNIQEAIGRVAVDTIDDLATYLQTLHQQQKINTGLARALWHSFETDETRNVRIKSAPVTNHPQENLITLAVILAGHHPQSAAIFLKNAVMHEDIPDTHHIVHKNSDRGVFLVLSNREHQRLLEAYLANRSTLECTHPENRITVNNYTPDPHQHPHVRSD